MRNLVFTALIACAVIVSNHISTTYAAEEIVYSNSSYEGSLFPPGQDEEIFDYGYSSGGRISKITFRYLNDSYKTDQVKIRFYKNIYISGHETGSLVKEIKIYNLPALGGYYDDYTYEIPEADCFQLPAGYFGYSFECSDNDTYLALARGGLQNQDDLWYYAGTYWGWQSFGWGGDPWAGIYFILYKSPPIDQVTCDIYGYKFDDADADGIWDAGESGIEGWELYIDENNNGTYETSEPNVVTDPNGMYLFENYPAPASYRVREINRTGWTQTAPGSAANYEYLLWTEPNNTYGPYNFANTDVPPGASISGKVFTDSNANSAYDAGEPGLSGWVVYVDENDNGRYDTGEKSATTNASGIYTLTNLSVGSHLVGEVMEDSWVQTFPVDYCTHPVTITASDETVIDVDFGNYTFYGYGGGSGTLADPYLIDSEFHLQAIGTHPWHWSSHFKLTSNILLRKYKGQQFNMIGSYYMGFTGTFDGNGFYIGAFAYSHTDGSSEYVGLFSNVNGPAAVIKNLTLYDINIQGGTYAGALVGKLAEGTIENCFVGRGTIANDGTAAGGMVGDLMEGTIINSHANIDVEVDAEFGTAGGLVGNNWIGTIQDCSAEGTIYSGRTAGGLIGSNSGYVTRCFAKTDITALQQVGGLVGENGGSIMYGTHYAGLLSECYAIGTIKNHDDYDIYMMGHETGGLVGRNISGADIENCYADVDITGGRSIGGLVGISWTTDPAEDVCTITNSYAVGSVTGDYNLYGLIASNTDSVITGCLWDTQTTGRSTSAAGTGKTTWQMKNPGTYTALGWDLTTPIWNICPKGGYPVLNWQSPSTGPGTVKLEWSKRQSGGYYSSGRFVGVDPDGNAVVASEQYIKHESGETNTDLLLSKYSPQGDLLWSKTYDSDPAGDISDTPIDMQIDQSGNVYVVLGFTRSNVVTLKYSSDGTLLWDRQYSGPENDDEAYGIAIDSLGNVYVAASSENASLNTDYCLIKYNADGVFQWAEFNDGGENASDYIAGVVVDSHDNIYITGKAGTYGDNPKMVTIKYDPDGTELWSDVYLFPVDTPIGVYQITVDDDDNIYIGINSRDLVLSDYDIVLAKYDSEGTMQWLRTFDDSVKTQDDPFISLDTQGNIYLAGTNYDSDSGYDYLVAKISSDGQYLWHRTYNGTANENDRIIAVDVDSQDNVYVTGMSNYYYEKVGYANVLKGAESLTQKYDSNGTLIWSISNYKTRNNPEFAYDIAVSDDGRVYVTGEYEGAFVFGDIKLLCYKDCSFNGDCDDDYGVTLSDFSVLAANWLDTGCDQCGKADFTGDENVTLADVRVFADSWMMGLPVESCQHCGSDFVAPAGVGLEDFAVISGCWDNINESCAQTDINHDKAIDLADILIFSNNWLVGR